MIEVESLSKSFRRPRRKEGAFGTVRTLFTREFDTTVAVEDVSFSIGDGELVGYLGPNGAGKSTTIKMLTGVLTPSGGSVTVNGLVPWRDREANARQIGAVFGQRSQLWWDLPLSDSLDLIGALYDVPADRFRSQLKVMRDLLGLDEFMSTPVRQLSLGQRMRGDLAASMLYEPRVLYLDEPTVGLDLLAKDAVREFVASINDRGDTTVILTTHDLADVERLCKRIILIDHGKLMYDGSIDRLIARYAPYKNVHVQLTKPADDRLSVGEFTADVTDDGTYRFVLDGGAEIHELLAALTASYGIRDLQVAEPDLESVIKRIYTEGAAS